MYRASRVNNVYRDVTDLSKTVRSLVETHELRDHAGSLCAELAWADVLWQWRSLLGVFEERAEKVNEE